MKEKRALPIILIIPGIFVLAIIIKSFISFFGDPTFNLFDIIIEIIFSIVPMTFFVGFVIIAMLVSKRAKANKEENTSDDNFKFKERKIDDSRLKVVIDDDKKVVGIIKKTYYEVEKINQDNHTFTNNEIYHYYVEFDYVDYDSKSKTGKIEISERNYDIVRFLRTIPLIVTSNDVYLDERTLNDKSNRGY